MSGVDVEPWCTCGAGEFQPPEAHAAACPGSAQSLAATETQPAEPAAGESGPAEDGARVPPAPGYGAGEKIASLVDHFLQAPPSASADVRAAMSAIRAAHRFRLLRPVLALFPETSEHAEWDQRIAAFVGIALNLTSDGVDLDVDACRQAGALILADLYGPE